MALKNSSIVIPGRMLRLVIGGSSFKFLGAGLNVVESKASSGSAGKNAGVVSQNAIFPELLFSIVSAVESGP
jgi:hypothetical protein